jgi:hypothetical protein
MWVSTDQLPRRIAVCHHSRAKQTFGFAPVITRRYDPGAHAVEPQINGQRLGRVEFELLAEEKGR